MLGAWQTFRANAFAAPVVNSGESKVIDTGPYESVQKIFDPFFTTKPAANGDGTGGFTNHRTSAPRQDLGR